MRALNCVFSLLILGLQSPAFALSTLYRTLPNYFAQPPPTLVSAGVGPPCSSLTSMRFVLPCNPALISESNLSPYSAQVFVGSGAQEIGKLQKLINHDQSPDFIESLVQDPILQTEANVQLNFRSRHIGMAIIPERLAYASVVRDESYPIIALEALQERSSVLQGGAEFYPGLFAGLQLRLVDRDFVANEFSLYDALADSGGDILAVHHQDAVYVEPGLAYFIPEDPWHSRVTLLLSNMGFANQQYSAIPMQPIFDFGFGVAPPVRFGDLEFALNCRASDPSSVNVDSLRLGGSYSLGLAQALVGLSHKGSSIGVISSVGAVRTGITFADERLDLGDGTTQYAKTIFTEFGLVY